MRKLILILDDIRSSLNVGALLRTADGLGIESVFMTGYTPYPMTENDTRLPHMANKIRARIDKTALGAAETVKWEHHADIYSLIKDLKEQGYKIAALEQDGDATLLPSFVPPEKLALIVGNEVVGVTKKVIESSDLTLEIPMLGKKESFNVAAAAAMALYHCRFYESTD